MYEKFLLAFGVIGSVIASAFGGWSTAMATLCFFMLIDYFTGVMLAVVFKKSSKGDGTFESYIGAKGIVKKLMIIILIYCMHRIDIEVGGNFLRDGSSVAFLTNELLSIVENAGLMGLPIPDVITNGISVLKNKANPEKKDQ